jgi:hypothetical protein
MDFQTKVVSSVSVIQAVQRAFNVTNMASVHAMIMLKAKTVTVVRKISMIGIKVVWIVLRATIWYKMLLISIELN